MKATHNDWWYPNPALVTPVLYLKGVLCKGEGGCPPPHEPGLFPLCWRLAEAHLLGPVPRTSKWLLWVLQIRDRHQQPFLASYHLRG